MATHSSILAFEISWTEEPGRLQSVGLRKSQTQLSHSTTIITFIRHLLFAVTSHVFFQRVFQIAL